MLKRSPGEVETTRETENLHKCGHASEEIYLNAVIFPRPPTTTTILQNKAFKDRF